MASVDEVVAELRQAVDHIHQAVTHARVARDMTEENRNRADALGACGLARQFAGIADTAERLLAMLVAGIDTGERLIAQAEAIRHGGGAAGAAGAAVPLSTASAPAPAAPLGMPILAGPDGLDRVLEVLPKRPNDEGRTTGQLFRENGRPVHRGTLLSFRDTSLLDDLDLPARARQSESMESHVETKAAKMMRDGQAPQHSTLVINNADGPCGWLRRQQGKRPTGTTCDEWLADVLPADSSLTVRWCDSTGVERSQVYRGTGRRIRR